MPLDTEEFSKLLGGLYDAVADPSQWNSFLGQLAQTIGATSALMGLRDASREICTITGSWQFDPEHSRLYREHYYSLDVWGKRGLSKPSGYICLSAELCSPSELATTEMYNDFMIRCEIEHGLFALVENTREFFATVSLYRGLSRPEFPASELETLRLLAPHLQRAFKLHLQFSQLKSFATGIEAALDLLPTPMIFLGKKGEVVLMNRSASALTAERDGLLATRDGLRASRMPESTLLEKITRQTALTSDGKGLSAGGTVMISRRSRPPLQLQISPIRNSMIQTSEPAAAVVLINDPLHQRPAQDVLRVLYGLTPAECRVALLLSDGHAPRQIANMIAVTDNTVRSQIKSIFSKTGVRRQGELIRLLLNNSGIAIPQWTSPA